MKTIKKNISFRIIIALLMALISIVGCTKYVQYVPIVLVVERGDHLLMEKPSLLSPEHVNSMKIILEKYDEVYKVENGKLFIKKSLQDDIDLLQNYTSKAEAYLREKQR